MSDQLIRHGSGSQFPTAGTWELPSTHVSVFAQAHPRARSSDRSPAPVAQGVLEVADDRSSTALTLSIRPAVGDPALGQLLTDDEDVLQLQISALAPTEAGDWSGRAHIENAVQCWAAELDVDHRGVYSTGERTVAWFVLRCEVITEASRRLGRRRSITFRVDVLAIAPDRPQVDLAA
jgi:hypothetical protein